MAWLGLRTQSERMFCPRGLGQDQAIAPLVDDTLGALMPRGTIMLETRLSPEGRLQTLVDFESIGLWPSALTLKAIPSGGIALVISQGVEIIHSAVKQPKRGRTDSLRIVYAWDAPARIARLSVQYPDSPIPEVTLIPDPKPLPVADVRAMVLNQNACQLDPDVEFLAVSDRIEPAGPTPGLLAGTMIITPQGDVPVHRLKRGDIVMTEAGEQMPVLHVIHQTAPARGSFQPILLRAPYFGLDTDMIVAAEQRILLDGSDVEYMFGREGVLVSAAHLTNGVAAVPVKTGPTMRYTQIILPKTEAFCAQGGFVQSLYLGRIRRDARKYDASVLGRLSPVDMPEHGATQHQILQRFEATALAQRRAA